MDLSEHYTPREFSITTKKYGIIEFSYLCVWRIELIINNTKNIKDIEPSEFCLIVAKYLLSKKENIVYDEQTYKKYKTFNDIKLILEKDELSIFANEFVTKYKDELFDYFNEDNTSTLDNYTIIKNYIIKYKEDFDRIVESTTRFTNLPYKGVTLAQVSKISETAKKALAGIQLREIEKITEAAKAFSSIPDNVLNKYTEISRIIENNPFKNIESFIALNKKINNAVNTPNIQTNINPRDIPPMPIDSKLEMLIEINKTLDNFIKSYYDFNDVNKQMLEFSNTTNCQIRDKIEEQVKGNNKTSRIAIFLSIVAICVAVLVGLLQFFLSKNSNKHIDKLNSSIEQLNNTILNSKLSYDNYAEQQEILPNEIFNQNENTTIDEPVISPQP